MQHRTLSQFSRLFENRLSLCLIINASHRLSIKIVAPHDLAGFERFWPSRILRIYSVNGRCDGVPLAYFGRCEKIGDLSGIISQWEDQD